VNIGENHGRCAETGISIEEPSGIEESVCIESVAWNWRDPTCHLRVKKMHISRNDENVVLARGSQRGK